MPWQGALILLPWSAPNAGPCGTDWCLCLLGNSSKRETPKPVVGRCLAAKRALRSLQGSIASLCHHLRPRRNEAACGCCCRSTSNEETTMVGAICTASFFSFSYVVLICSSDGSGSTRNRQHFLPNIIFFFKVSSSINYTFWKTKKYINEEKSW